MAAGQKNIWQLHPSVSRTYPEVVRHKPQEYWDYEHTRLFYGSPDPYELVGKVGAGKYSDVFDAVNVKLKQPCIIKVLKAVGMRRIKREIKILNNLRGGPHIIKILDIVPSPITNTAALVMEHVNNVDHKTLYPTFSTKDIQFYMFRLLTALDYAHSNGIMHRDVKPPNVMIDPTRRILRLIDWGLAEFYFTCQNYHVTVASRYFKAPELLLDYVFYDYSVDMWSFGCMLAGMVFRREPFFRGRDNIDQLVKIVKVLGQASLQEYAASYRITLDPNFVNLVQGLQKTPWVDFVDSTNQDVADSRALDLIANLLKFDHYTRFTAREALEHPFFENVESPTPENAGTVGLPAFNRED